MAMTAAEHAARGQSGEREWRARVMARRTFIEDVDGRMCRGARQDEDGGEWVGGREAEGAVVGGAMVDDGAVAVREASGERGIAVGGVGRGVLCSEG